MRKGGREVADAVRVQQVDRKVADVVRVQQGGRKIVRCDVFFRVI